MVDFREHLNFMEGTCVEHKDHSAFLSHFNSGTTPVKKNKKKKVGENYGQLCNQGSGGSRLDQSRDFTKEMT